MSARLRFVPILLFLVCLIAGKDLAAGGWHIHEALGQKNCKFPDVAVDPNGNCVAAWIYFDGTHSYAQAATKPVDGSWSAPFTFTMAEHEAQSISVAIDQKGNAVAVWTSTDGKFSMVQSARLSDFGSNDWKSFHEPLTILVFMGSYPKVQLDAQGNAMAVWGVYDGNKTVIEAARLPLGATSWTRMHDRTQLSHDISCLEFALNPSGNAVAVWESHVDAQPVQIYTAALSADSSEWTEPVLLSSERFSAVCPKIAVDSEGNAVAAWWTLSKSIKAARLPFGQKEWQRTRLPIINSPFFSLGITPDGDALMIWEPSKPGSIRYSVLPKMKAVWTKPAPVSTKGEEARSPILSMNSKGNVVAIWENHMRGCIQGAALRMNTKVWTPPKSLGHIPLEALRGRPALNFYGLDSAVLLYPASDSVQAVYGKDLFGLKHLHANPVNQEIKQLKLFRKLKQKLNRQK
ncbi:MAG: hypothetical protein LLG04_13940 [Parachlamydia sp.]|nr:hypothetical protein [Parachlamydia sp.]